MRFRLFLPIGAVHVIVLFVSRLSALPIPKLLYEFNDETETMSGGDPTYSLTMTYGDPLIVDGVARCDGIDDALFSATNLDFDLQSHSLEVLVKLNSLDNVGAGTIAIVESYTTAGAWVTPYVFDAIVYDERSDGRWLDGTEYHARTISQAEGGVAETSLDWIHMVISYDIENSVVNIYRNGQLYATHSPSSFMTVDSTATNGARMMFCRRHTSSGAEELNGDIDYGALYDYALSAAEVQELYANGGPGTATTSSPTTLSPTTAAPTTAAPTTAAPTTAQPTGAPTCDVSNIATFDWDELMASGTDQPQVVDFTMDVNETDLSLNIVAKLTYEGMSSADDNGAVYGTTYVLDFEDFDAHSDDIRLPGTCQNRNAADFAGDFSTFWDYSTNPSESGSVGTVNYLAYPPANPDVGSWTVYMDEETDVCGVVVYEGTFTWNDLVGCTSNDGAVSYIATEETEGDDPTIILSGTFYINVVSPYSYSGDFGYYRVYQVLSQPFVITIHRKVYVVEAAGINVLTISVIAVYKEDGASVFKLVVLTEAQEYLQLTRSDSSLYTFQSSSTESAQITIGDFTVATSAETSGSSPTDGCLDNKAFICSQLWQIVMDCLGIVWDCFNNP